MTEISKRKVPLPGGQRVANDFCRADLRLGAALIAPLLADSSLARGLRPARGVSQEN